MLRVQRLVLKLPIIKPAERKLMANPASFLGSLYGVRSRRSEATLLENITLTLDRGERLGLIGGNGAGKSTLLRVLAGIYAPTAGKLEVNGTVRGLFAISLGMNAEATGLENIYLRGMQMGFTLGEIRRMVPEIVAFAGIEDAIGKPLVTYSAGMKLRLAFAISSIVEPDILLLDEWIGTGDDQFRARVKARMDQLVERSSALVIATHNRGLMKSLCTRGVVLKQGRIAFSGKVDDCLAWYGDDIKASEQKAAE